MAAPLEIVNGALDEITKTLVDLGIEVSAFMLQLLMLVLIVVVLLAMRRRFIPLSKLNGPNAAMLAVPVLIGLGIVVSWGDQWLNPPERTVVAGMIDAEDRNDLRVALLSVEGRPMQTGSPIVEVQSGEFLARYDYGITRYPRHIQISRRGCEQQLEPVSLSQLRTGHDFQIIFECNAHE
jgi:hypothetical protein